MPTSSKTNTKSKSKSKSINVREHPRRVPVSKKNPSGVTIVDRHPRHIKGRYLDISMIDSIIEISDRSNLKHPARGKLGLPNEDAYDEYIAIWIDYFSKALALESPLDPNMVKALIASESTFNPNAEKILRRPATPDEVIQLYKGILDDSSNKAQDIMKKYREFYGKLTKK